MEKNKENAEQLALEDNLTSLHSQFEKHALQCPKSTALIWKNKSITYHELDIAASAFAIELSLKRVGDGIIIPILLTRSPELIISLLAVLKTGAAYTLLDPCWPENRIKQIINLLNSSFIITDNESIYLNRIIKIHPNSLFKNIGTAYNSRKVSSLSPASIFFTSGTTGEPKGVISTHKGTLRLFKDNSFATFNNNTIIPLAAALPWDAFSLELWGSLVNGGSSWIIDEPFLSSTALRNGISDGGVNTIWMTSSLFNMIVEEDINTFTGLEQVMIGGERVSQSHVRHFLESHPTIKLINGYGPVETTIFASTHQICINDCESESGVPIGSAVPETQLYVLNDKMELCRDEEIGQICIGGNGLALGYINDPKLTNIKFIVTSLQGEKKLLYQTGDLGFWENDLLHFHGRRDRQVKVLGHRIELSEIEHQILKLLSNIKSCKVVAQKDKKNSSHELIAFCIPSNPNDLLVGAHKILKSNLVSYQCPKKVIPVSTFPLTPQGKLDENELLNNISQLKNNEHTNRAKQHMTLLEKTIIKILRSCVNLDFIPLNVSFNTLGISSLDLGRFCSRLGKALNIPISIAVFYRYNTISSLGSFLDDRLSNSNQKIYIEHQDDKMNQMQLMYLIQHLSNPLNLASRCLMTWSIEGNLDLCALRNAICYVHIKNKALRSKYLPDQDLVESNETITFPELEILPYEHSKEAGITKLISELSKELDPLNGKIWRTALVPVSESNSHFFGCAIHHIAFDGYSEHLLAENLSAGYLNALTQSHPNLSNSSKLLIHNLTPDNLNLKLSAAALKYINSLMNTPEINWQENFEDNIKETDHLLEHSFIIPSSQMELLNKISVKYKVSRFVLLFHAWANALQEVIGQSDFCVGIPVRQRSNSMTIDTINCHLNMICPRLNDKVFTKKLAGLMETSQIIQESLSNQDIPFRQILEFLNPKQTGRTPLFQTLFALQDNPPPELKLKGLKCEFIRQPYLDTPLELHAELWLEKDESIRFVVSRREFISLTVVQKLINNFRQNLREILTY